MGRRGTERAALARWAVAAAVLAACVPAKGPLMNPGADCLSCHGGQTGARRWTVAGTLYDSPYSPGSPGIQGAHVQITDANGRSFTVRTNRVGNFYTAEPVAFPLRVCAERGGATSCMEEEVTRGACNVCHGPQGAENPDVHARLFPIGAGTPHAAVGCAQCHGPGTGPAANLCATCHAALDPSLEPRHTTSTSDPAVVVSDFVLESAACLRCHGDGQVDRTADHPAGFEGTPPHEGATCLVCHDVYRADKPWAADFATSPASWPAGSGHGCVRCHTGGVLSAGDHARLFPIGAGTPHAAVGCAQCHGPGTGPPAKLCATCHAALDPSLEPHHTTSTSDPSVVVSDFVLESATCLRCHGDGQVNLTADHPSGSEGTPPHQGATCLVCHDVFRTDKPWAADFATSPASWPAGSGHGCLHCHTGGVPPGD